YLRFVFSSLIITSVMFFVQSAAFAQSSGAEGQDLQAPWTMGNIIIVLFAISLFALAVRSSRRDFSAIPDEFGNRPNARNLKKKKGKQKLDFSRGPVKHPDLERATTLTIVALFLPFMILFSLPIATRVRDEIKGDPRFLGEGTAKTLAILNYIWVGMWLLIIIGVIVGVLVFVVAGGGAG
ncbi:MAG: hypothetical protein FWH27_07230, partial [Planctomycetaceae bacterium]|nr:hypothetical protein [Planctomycetaceae bacterium]